jgi:hypothetical protein
VSQSLVNELHIINSGQAKVSSELSRQPRAWRPGLRTSRKDYESLIQLYGRNNSPTIVSAQVDVVNRADNLASVSGCHARQVLVVREAPPRTFSVKLTESGRFTLHCWLRSCRLGGFKPRFQ